MRHAGIRQARSGTAPQSFSVAPGGSGGLRVECQGERLVAADQHGNWLSAVALEGTWNDARSSTDLPAALRIQLLAAMLGFAFSTDPGCAEVVLAGGDWLADRMTIGDLAGYDIGGAVKIRADMFWQVAPLWTPRQPVPFPRHDVYDGRTFHPLRPPKPIGRVYRRFIPWLQGEMTLDVATLDDLADIHRWMNLPRVNQFWHEAGERAHHRKYLEGMFADPHIIPLMARFDEQAFGYFEVYWAKEDLVGSFCAAGDYDRGCHVIIGEEAFRGSAWFTAWLPSLLHFMFLDDPRTERIVQEPQADHYRQLRNLQRSGFFHTATVDLPNKRAAIVEISRRKFFSERLWHPDGVAQGARA